MNTLMEKLAIAKKIMDKVDSGSYEKGQINETILRSDPEELLKQNLSPSEKSYEHDQTEHLTPNVKQIIDVEKIKNSKLPEAIKEAMIKNPIQQFPFNESIDKKIIDGAKRLMNEDTKKTTTQLKSVHNNINQHHLIEQLTPVIENIVRKTITEILDTKLNQILTAQQVMSINENLVLKVGDSIFKGKITGVNKPK